MNMNGIFFARRLQLHHQVPRTPTNEERIRAYRAMAPVMLGNAYFVERLRARDYEREAVPGPDYAQDMRDGFAFKYKGAEL